MGVWPSCWGCCCWVGVWGGAVGELGMQPKSEGWVERHGGYGVGLSVEGEEMVLEADLQDKGDVGDLQPPTSP